MFYKVFLWQLVFWDVDGVIWGSVCQGYRNIGYQSILLDL